MSAELRVLIIGAYGNFGGRLVQLLEDDARLTLLVAGRSLPRAESYCAQRSRVAARLVPTVFDRARSDRQQLEALCVDIVVDTSGPFQVYGDHAYGLVEHCIACGVHYIDLADGSDFVVGIMQFDAAARLAGVFVLSGASSFPVLTIAVVRRLCSDVERVGSVRAGIAPSPYAVVGLNVIRAIASYAGKPVQLRRRGRPAMGRPFTECIRFVIAVPGQIPLKRRRFSLVDVPDLRLLPEIWTEATDIWIGAAPVPAVLHGVLCACAWLVRVHLLTGLSWMAGSMHTMINHLRWGEPRGGMFVKLTGAGSNGDPVDREWHLQVEGDDGPLIPSMAAATIIRKCLNGDRPRAGARAAITDVELSDYEALFAARAIETGTRDCALTGRVPLFQRILGNSWERLAPAIRELHSVTSTASFAGRCSVVRGRNVLAWIIATVIGFPQAGQDQDIHVQLVVQGTGERWTRSTGRRSFSSTQRPGRGASKHLVREAFGPICIDMALVVEGCNLRYIARRWSAFGVPMPLFLGPRTNTVESVMNGKFKFDVEIRLPLIGLVVRYVGVLSPSG
jgi:hypothetical protein